MRQWKNKKTKPKNSIQFILIIQFEKFNFVRKKSKFEIYRPCAKFTKLIQVGPPNKQRNYYYFRTQHC